MLACGGERIRTAVRDRLADRAGPPRRRGLDAAPRRPRRPQHAALVPRPPLRHARPDDRPPRRRRDAPRRAGTHALSDLVREPAALRRGPPARARDRAPRPASCKRSAASTAGFVAVGMATWLGAAAPPARRPRRCCCAAACCARRRRRSDDFELDLGDEIELNPVLERLPRAPSRASTIDRRRLEDLAHARNGFDPYPAYAALARGVRAGRRLRASLRARARHLLLREAADGRRPRRARRRPRRPRRHRRHSPATATALASGPARLPDTRARRPPDPATSSSCSTPTPRSRTAIEAARAGAHLVINGPPGTGKSPDHRQPHRHPRRRRQAVLFVAEKRAAIDAVVGPPRPGRARRPRPRPATTAPASKRAIAQRARPSPAPALATTRSPPSRDADRLARAPPPRCSSTATRCTSTASPWGVSAHDVPGG